MRIIIYRFFLTFITLILVSLIYLSTIGIKTEKFNSKILNQIKKIDKNLDIELKEVSIILNPLKFEINSKTIGTNLIYGDKIVQLESIKSKISLKSLIDGKFSISKINISTKSLDLKNLISFFRLYKKDPKIYFAEQFVRKGFVIADIEVEFDDNGNVKNNYKIKGLVKNGKINTIQQFDLNKIDFSFNIESENLKLENLKFNINNKNILVPEAKIKKKKNEFLVSGKLNNKSTVINEKDLNYFIEKDFLNLNIQELIFDSNNTFNFKINKNFKINNLNILSKISLNNLKIKNSFKLKRYFPKIKNEILLKDHKIEISYRKNEVDIKGSGDLILQEKIDKIDYKIFKNKKEINYITSLTIKKNLFNLDLFNFKKDKNSDLNINIKAKKIHNKDLIFEEASIKEKDNFISINNLLFSNNFRIKSIENITTDFIDNENLKNKIRITKKNKTYLVKGNSFNINKIISDLLDSSDNKNTELFKNNFKIDIDVKKIYLDKNYIINNFLGYLFLKNNKIVELDLEGRFSNDSDIKLTIKSDGNEQITTLFSEEAKPLVDRYKFIKGFNEGNLDFYSVKKNNTSNSTLKIFNFKLKELPVLTKILTLASLQGIADLLSGEGIRFDEFEMKFSNKNNLLTIEEIYAIGPAISILMNGYIEKGKLISLRGTLVPATTINKTIGSIPILGDILVGKKIGEGVFGVSFKIKGPPKDLETTVNPIKTLTPRFITRTLEKIKKN